MYCGTVDSYGHHTAMFSRSKDLSPGQRPPDVLPRLLSVVEQAATRMSPNGGMVTGKITLGQMAAACRQHDQVGDEDVIALRGVLNRIAPDKVIKLNASLLLCLSLIQMDCYGEGGMQRVHTPNRLSIPTS